MSTTSVVAAALARTPANDLGPRNDLGIQNTLLDRVGNAYARQKALDLPLLQADHMSLPQLRALPVGGTALEIADGALWEQGKRTNQTLGDLMDIFGIGRQQLTVLLAPDSRGRLSGGTLASRFYDLMVH
jgi:hypothetical protein